MLNIVQDSVDVVSIAKEMVVLRVMVNMMMENYYQKIAPMIIMNMRMKKDKEESGKISEKGETLKTNSIMNSQSKNNRIGNDDCFEQPNISMAGALMLLDKQKSSQSSIFDIQKFDCYFKKSLEAF